MSAHASARSTRQPSWQALQLPCRPLFELTTTLLVGSFLIASYVKPGMGAFYYLRQFLRPRTNTLRQPTSFESESLP